MQSTAAFCDRLETDGFAVIEGFKSPAQVEALRARAAEIVDAFDPATASGVFSTKNTQRSDDYFLDSGTAVRCFFEEEAFDENGALKQAKSLSINKIGHAMHDLDPVFERFSKGPELDALVREAGLADPRVYQSMYIFKQPHIGGEVRWHQDAPFFWTEPQSVLTLWFALERADRNNGCLWAQRGGHRTPLRDRFVVNDRVGRMVTLDETPWPSVDEAEPIEVESGTLVVFAGSLPHYSAPNRSAASRHAYTLHVVDGNAQYAPENWIQRTPEFLAKGFI
jgi:phytanoyl-CoA hydroxylase